jgi:tetratricopeptide (TPR) repeat protein
MRLLTTVLFAALASASVLTPAHADDPAATAAPTPEQLAQAKKAFEEGNALFKAGKLDEAVVKLKESYRLSKNAFLLYNIGQTYDLLSQKDLVLFYYRKFLASAPATAPMRPTVEKRVAALEAENVQAATPEGETAGNDAAVTAPTSKFGANDFKHVTIDTAPPGWPIDIAAQLPPESGFTVKLFYRSSGDGSFISKPMTWRNYELVARIPGTKATGKWVQYYIEVRDAADKLVTRSGKSTSPNLVNIEANAKKQYYADYVDEGGEVVAPAPIEGEHLGEAGPTPEGKPSATVRTLKWVTSGVALGLFGTSLISYSMAGSQHDKLIEDSRMCGTPPCQVFDESFGQRVQTLGKRYDTMYKVTLGLGIATAGVAAYLWYRDAKAHRHKAQSDTPTAWMITPTVDAHFAGASAAAEF